MKSTIGQAARLLHQAALMSRRVNELCAKRQAELGIQSIFGSLALGANKQCKCAQKTPEQGKPVPSIRVKRHKALSKSVSFQRPLGSSKK
jgi:hypothetical protein